MQPIAIIRQALPPGSPASTELSAVGQVALLRDIRLVRSDINALSTHRELLCSGGLPVGSVEFVREAIKVAGVIEPSSVSYPVPLDGHLGRKLDLMPLGRVRGRQFVKPATTKLFTGFVWDPALKDSEYSEHDLEQLTVLRALPPQTMVWVSPPVKFLCEHRIYVDAGVILGSARYDQDGADDAPWPDTDVVRKAVDVLSGTQDFPVSYGLDVGVLDSGETVLVEVNDAWALGYYGNAIEPKDYLAMLTRRWMQILGR
ncbi:hypothetical protein ABIC83_003017 [Roseateles asaccharophilus]|uniref:ATP-grasp domain-containing protein n=1 Tax=Roseateles asaccharophilus TaxID=582607 RepID=UPI003833C4DB